MNQIEQSASDALPLAAAATRLGISPDALRMRINRGKIRGFKRGGRLFAVLDEAPNPAARTARNETEQTTPERPERPERTRDRPPSPRHPDEGPDPGDASSRPAAADPGEPSLPLVVEFQKIELSRLLRDNARLNQRLDQFFEELRHLREMQQREQVLRQQDQALRQRTQALIERLTAPPTVAPPTVAPPASAPPASAPAVAPTDAGPPDPGPAAAKSARAAPVDIPRGPATKAESRSEPPDLHREDPVYAYQEGASPPKPPPEPSPEPGQSWDSAQRDTAELATLLKDIGASLRDLESAAANGLATTAPDLPRPDQARTGPEPLLVPAARRTPGDFTGPPSGPPLGPPADDEAGLLEILGRMGPSAEERRTAGRLMKRLFKGRGARRRSEPGDDAW